MLSNNALALIYYIINYSTKTDCTQYQPIIGAAFVKKAYNDIQLLSTNVITYVAPDKFALRAFNHLAYNQEINDPLVISYLLGLPNYYTLLDNVKYINLTLVQKRFPKFALHIYKLRLAIDHFVRLQRQKSTSLTMFYHHSCWRNRFQKFLYFCLHAHYQYISVEAFKCKRHWVSV